jgi:diacylglycerol O-acyltransferase / wax synthase
VPHASLEDAVLAVCGGTLRRYLGALDELPASSLSAVMPVRQAADPSGLSWLRVQLHSDVDDPVQRLARIHEQTAGLLPDAADAPAAGEHGDLSTLALSSRMQGSSALRNSRRAPAACCTITHVAGPAVPLYLNGAHMTYFSAIMPISDGMGLVFAVTRYDGRIIISPTSCRELMPDPEGFTQHLRDSFQEYLALARAASTPKARSARPRGSAPGSAPRPRLKAHKASTAPRAASAGRRRSAAPAG